MCLIISKIGHFPTTFSVAPTTFSVFQTTFSVFQTTFSVSIDHL